MTKVHAVARSFSLALVVAAFGCSPGSGGQSGTETGNPPLGFETTECKKDIATDPESSPLSTRRGGPELRPTAASGGTPSAFLNSRYDGLTCFVWERLDDERLLVQVTNHADGCGADEYFAPEAELSDDGTLTLRLDNPTCSIALCGFCTYDLAFTVQAPSSLSQLDVELYGNTCNGPAPLKGEAQLSLASADRGETCQYAQSSALFWSERCPDHERFAPCHAENECNTAGGFCSEGLSCVEVSEGDPRCLPVCQSDADCADIATTHCEEGTCRL